MFLSTSERKVDQHQWEALREVVIAISGMVAPAHGQMLLD